MAAKEDLWWVYISSFGIHFAVWITGWISTSFCDQCNVTQARCYCHQLSVNKMCLQTSHQHWCWHPLSHRNSLESLNMWQLGITLSYDGRYCHIWATHISRSATQGCAHSEKRVSMIFLWHVMQFNVFRKPRPSLKCAQGDWPWRPGYWWDSPLRTALPWDPHRFRLWCTEHRLITDFYSPLCLRVYILVSNSVDLDSLLDYHTP